MQARPAVVSSFYLLQPVSVHLPHSVQWRSPLFSPAMYGLQRSQPGPRTCNGRLMTPAAGWRGASMSIPTYQHRRSLARRSIGAMSHAQPIRSVARPAWFRRSPAHPARRASRLSAHTSRRGSRTCGATARAQSGPSHRRQGPPGPREVGRETPPGHGATCCATPGEDGGWASPPPRTPEPLSSPGRAPAPIPGRPGPGGTHLPSCPGMHHAPAGGTSHPEGACITA
jgi:hypothetical protein